MNTRVLRSVALVFSLSTAVHAAENDMAFSGVGAGSCADFAQKYQADPATAETVYFSWAQGFMSGFNGALLTMGNPSRNVGLAMESQMSRLRAYCDQHPLSSYSRAVVDLYMSLPLNGSTRK